MTETLMFEEQKERAKYYLESALKILGIAQISIASADIFWGGHLKFTMYNTLILTTGIIFFFGAESLKKNLKKIIKKEDKQEEILRFESDRVFFPHHGVLNNFKEEKKKEYEEKYSFLRKK